MNDNPRQQRFRDRDVLLDNEGRVFVVLGHIQPRDRVISFLKYIPDPQGRWALGSQKYRRVFWGGVDSVVNGIDTVPKHYVIQDSHFGTDLLEVPTEDIQRHFLPEERLGAIMEEGPVDRLEASAMGLAVALHETLGIDYSDIGVAGSILWKAHNPSFSDVNMNIYGFDNSWRLKQNCDLVCSADKVRLRESGEWLKATERIRERIPTLAQRDIDRLFKRRFAFYYGDQCIGVTPVLRPEECPIRYGEESYQTLSNEPIKTLFDVADSRYGLFCPGIIKGTSPSLDRFHGIKVSRLLIYDGVFAGLIEEGDTIEVVGTLQRVNPVGEIGESFYQIMVGTKEGGGKELVRFL